MELISIYAFGKRIDCNFSLEKVDITLARADITLERVAITIGRADTSP